MLAESLSAVDPSGRDAEALRNSAREPRLDVAERSLSSGTRLARAVDRPSPLGHDAQPARLERLPARVPLDLAARRLEDAAALDDANGVELEPVLLGDTPANGVEQILALGRIEPFPNRLRDDHELFRAVGFGAECSRE